MSGFLTPLQVEAVDANTWRLLTDLEWEGSQGDIFCVEKGSMTDFATVPWWTQSLIPKTGTWTKAAVVHDKMCDDLNEYYGRKKYLDEFGAEWAGTDYANSDGLVLEVPPWAESLEEPLFSSTDTDAIFRKISRDEGTGWVRSELLWLGVRCGALINPARRKGWLSTFPRFLGDLVAIVAMLSVFIFLLTKVL